MQYDYSKLRGRIVEVCGTITNFAAKMGLSKVMMSQKLNNVCGWSQSDIVNACDILQIPLSEAGIYFLNRKYGDSKLSEEQGTVNA